MARLNAELCADQESMVKKREPVSFIERFAVGEHADAETETKIMVAKIKFARARAAGFYPLIFADELQRAAPRKGQP